MALERVQKIIAASGFCSRRNAENLISQGCVLLNGRKVLLGKKAYPKKDKVYIDGNLLKK